MMFKELIRIPAQRVRSLVWSGDELIDWAGGIARYRLDGTKVPSSVGYSYRFDAACQSPSGEYSVIYERRGTKGLVLQKGAILREINRSFYHAGTYEYPITFGRLPDGRELLIHCPDHYNRLEIEDAATGEVLTKSEARKPTDFFHSRLAVNRAGTLLLSGGWIWSPCDALAVFSLADCLSDPTALDQRNQFPGPGTEISSAAFLGDDRLVVATSEETFLDEEDFLEPNTLRPNCLVTWDLANRRIVSQVKVSEPVGTLLVVGDDAVVGFHDHPKLFDLRTGETIARCADVSTGKQLSSIIHHIDAVPPLALDDGNRRFAVATDTEVRVFEVG